MTSSGLKESLKALSKPAGNVLKSMRVGNIAEKLVIETLNTYGYDAKKNEDKAKKYDYDVLATINGKEVSFEVKFDVMAARTGNIAIEYWNSKKNQPSGIMVTKADYWVHVIEDEEQTKLVYVTPVANLKKFIELNKPKRTIESGGDNNANLYLYSTEVILSCFSELNPSFFSQF